MSPQDGTSHTDRVAQLRWLTRLEGAGARREMFSLVSVGSDGRVLIWNPSNKKRDELSLKSQFVVNTSSVSKVSRRLSQLSPSPSALRPSVRRAHPCPHPLPQRIGCHPRGAGMASCAVVCPPRDVPHAKIRPNPHPSPPCTRSR